MSGKIGFYKPKGKSKQSIKSDWEKSPKRTKTFGKSGAGISKAGAVMGAAAILVSLLGTKEKK